MAVARFSSDTLCTSGFVDNIMFSHNIIEKMDQNEWQRIRFDQFSRWRHRGEICRLQLHLVRIITTISKQIHLKNTVYFLSILSKYALFLAELWNSCSWLLFIYSFKFWSNFSHGRLFGSTHITCIHIHKRNIFSWDSNLTFMTLTF